MPISHEEIEKHVKNSYELPNRVLEFIPEPLVSIRTATYQQAKYIKQCIDGVLMQKTTFPFEFIIGEDYSTDGTREIVFDYARKYPDIIRVITADYHVGRANGRRCAKACRGKYIALCEGDDYWTDPYKLQKQVDFLESNPAYGLVHTNVLHLKNGVFEKNSIDNSKPKSGNIYEYLLYENTLCTASALYRSQFVKELKSNNDRYKFKSGDKFLWLYIAYNAKIEYIDDVTTVYRFVDDSVSHQKNLQKRAEFIKSSIELSWYYIDKYGCSNEMQKRIYKKHIHIGLGLKSASIIKEGYSRLAQIKQLTWKDKFIILMASNRNLLYIYARFNAFLRKLKLPAGESNQ